MTKESRVNHLRWMMEVAVMELHNGEIDCRKAKYIIRGVIYFVRAGGVSEREQRQVEKSYRLFYNEMQNICG